MSDFPTSTGVSTTGGAGASGEVTITWVTGSLTPTCTGGSLTSAGGNTTCTFTASGSFTAVTVAAPVPLWTFFGW